MKESTFGRTLRLKCSEHGQWTRIENIAGAGIPDVNWYPGQDVWIELKATTTNRISFQASQISWGRRRHKSGGKVWIVIRTKNEIIITESRSVYEKMRYSNCKPWLHVTVAQDWGVTFKPPFKWDIIRDLLLGELTLGEEYCKYGALM